MLFASVVKVLGPYPIARPDPISSPVAHAGVAVGVPTGGVLVRVGVLLGVVVGGTMVGVAVARRRN